MNEGRLRAAERRISCCARRPRCRIASPSSFAWAGQSARRFGAYTPVSMRMANVPGGSLLFKLPAPKPMIKAILKQVGLKDAIANGKVSDAFLAAFRSVVNDTDTMANELKQGPPLMTPIKGFNDAILISDADLARVTLPTYFLWGTNDPMGGEAIAKPFAAKVPNSTLEMFSGGHAIWVDDAAGVATRLRTFLQN